MHRMTKAVTAPSITSGARWSRFWYWMSACTRLRVPFFTIPRPGMSAMVIALSQATAIQSSRDAG